MAHLEDFARALDAAVPEQVKEIVPAGLELDAPLRLHLLENGDLSPSSKQAGEPPVDGSDQTGRFWHCLQAFESHDRGMSRSPSRASTSGQRAA